ncbi:MAG: hypothetical protein ACI4IF_05830 [Acutalibacteraceae bacterium]
MKKLKIAGIIVAVLLVFVGSFFLWAYNNPNVVVSKGSPMEETEMYVETVMVGVSPPFNLPIPISDTVEQNAEEFAMKTQEMHLKIMQNYEAPCHIEIRMDVKDDKTYLTYFGTATTVNGDKGEFEEVITFDFVIADEITEVG